MVVKTNHLNTVLQNLTLAEIRIIQLESDLRFSQERLKLAKQQLRSPDDKDKLIEQLSRYKAEVSQLNRKIKEMSEGNHASLKRRSRSRQKKMEKKKQSQLNPQHQSKVYGSLVDD